MAFNNPDEVIKQFNLSYNSTEFIDLKQEFSLDVPAWLEPEILFALQNRGTDDKEAFMAEFIVVPCLREVWKRHPDLSLFSHPQIKADDMVVIPDYLVSKKPAHGYKRLTKPLLLTVEAKDEDFDQGWTQAMYQAVLCQKLNGTPEIPILCIVTTGDTWQFGKLVKQVFYKHPFSVSLDNLPRLLGVIDYLFQQCEENAKLQQLSR